MSAQIGFTINEVELGDLTGHLVRLIESLETFAETRRPRRRALDDEHGSRRGRLLSRRHVMLPQTGHIGTNYS